MKIQYCTLDALKEYIGIIDSDSDNMLTRVIARVTAQFDLYVGHNIGEEERFEGVTDAEVIRSQILDVEQACLEVCNLLWNDTPASGNEANIKAKQIETLSKSYFSKEEMAGGNQYDFREVLDNYRGNFILSL